MKPLIVGQAPSRDHGEDEPLSGRSGRRLADLCGLDLAAFLERFDRANLLDDFPGKAGKGDLFPRHEARERAMIMMILGDLQDRKVVLLGNAVARAFCLPVGLRPLTWIPGLAIRASVCPHPSGVSRWWNEPANIARARRFWRALAGEAPRP